MLHEAADIRMIHKGAGSSESGNGHFFIGCNGISLDDGVGTEFTGKRTEHVVSWLTEGIGRQAQLTVSVTGTLMLVVPSALR